MTKKCKSCQKEIDQKATRCPHCRADQRGWFRRHPILTGLMVLIVVGVIGSAASSGGNSGQSGNTDSKTAQTQEKEQEPTAIEASTLANAFDANQVAAEKEWGGKFVQFSAKVSNITDSGISFYNVATEKEFSTTQISCHVKDKEQLLSLSNGQVITVKGIVGTQTIGVIGIDDCQVVK